MVLSCQVWFDTEAPEAFERDGLDTTATTEQHLRTLARPEDRIGSPREISANYKFLNTSVGTQEVEGEFAVRYVTKLTDAAGQPTDEGREARPSEAGGPVRSVESPERIMRLLRNKRSFSELKDQKGEHVTPCDEKLCERESSQARQMNRGEIEVEEERRVRAKRAPVLPTDKEKDEGEIMHMTTRSQCDRRFPQVFTKRVAVPRVTMDRGPFAHDVYTDPVLIQGIHSVVETCQVLHESSETRAVNGVLENLDTCGLDEVLLKRDAGSAIRILVDPARVGREEKTMAERCSKYLHQSNGTSENTVENIDTPVTNSDCVLPEWSGCKIASESIAPSQIGHTVRVLSRSERCRDDHNERVRLRRRRSRAELLLKSETVNPEHVRGEMAKLNPSEATEFSLDSTNRDGERLPQRRTARKQWQPSAFTNFTGVPRNPKELTRELMTGNRRKCISKFSIQRYGETPGCSECLGASSRRTTTCQERFERLGRRRRRGEKKKKKNNKKGEEEERRRIRRGEEEEEEGRKTEEEEEKKKRRREEKKKKKKRRRREEEKKKNRRRREKEKNKKRRRREEEKKKREEKKREEKKRRRREKRKKKRRRRRRRGEEEEEEKKKKKKRREEEKKNNKRRREEEKKRKREEETEEKRAAWRHQQT